MKKSLLFMALIVNLEMMAQQGDELLVYTVKGEVTAIFKNEETTVKIGRVLLPGTTIKTKKDASLTMVCKRGKPLCVTTEGVFPISNWKDSCRTTKTSITTNYFMYIWNQFYTYSPEYKENQRKRNELAVTRGEGPYRIKVNTSNGITVDFSSGMDIVNYGGGSFPLSWTCFDYNGKFIFTLFDAKGTRVLYRDSLYENYVPIEELKQFLETGKSYKWNIIAPNAGFIRKRVLNCVNPAQIQAYIDSLSQPSAIPEDSASRYFRIAFLLEKKHYLADALNWYQKATLADSSIEAYRDKFIRFRNEFWIR